LLLLLIELAGAVRQQPSQQSLDAPALNPALVAHVNSHPTATWRASLEQGPFFDSSTLRQAQALMGVKPRAEAETLKAKAKMTHKPKPTAAQIAALPTTFDSRLAWPQCWTITQIRDQSACGSCWAHAFAEAASDRECTYGVNLNLTLSVQVINSCCDECGNGCDGGQIDVPWQYWTDTGDVSANCQPYTLPSCDHHIANSTNPCPTVEYPTPPCTAPNCVNGKPWNPYYGANPSYIDTGDVDSIAVEIQTNGPVQTAFDVYEDFLSYKSGVYQHTTGAFLGGHSVKIIGWGVENGVKYWLVANSWNAHWGNKGFFKIIRGTDDCGFEDYVTFGEPAQSRK